VIWDKAQELGRQIGQSSEYQALRRAESSLREDKETVAQLDQIQTLARQVDQAIAQGQMPDQTTAEAYENAVRDLETSVVGQAYVVARSNFEKLMARVNQQISEGMEKGATSSIITKITPAASPLSSPTLCESVAISSLHRMPAMSGHSKWSSIKHKKGAADAKRGKLFTKLARAITVAARDGGPDPEGNPPLATAVQKARDASMPKENIQRAIDRGSGVGTDAAAIESVLFEGYGPGGAAILVEALTDNRNRTSADVRHAFSKHHGNLGEPGSVAWIFEKRGAVVVDGERYDEDDLIVAIDAGAEDVREDGEQLRVLCEPGNLGAVREALVGAGVEIESADLTMEPKNTVMVKGSEAEWLLRLVDALEEHDDVNEVHANFDVPAEIIEKMAA